MKRKSKTKPMPVDTKNQDCETCKCADGGKCYHFAFMGKSGKPLLARWLLRPALDLWRKQPGRKLNINIHPWAMPGPGQSVKMA